MFQLYDQLIVKEAELQSMKVEDELQEQERGGGDRERPAGRCVCVHRTHL